MEHPHDPSHPGHASHPSHWRSPGHSGTPGSLDALLCPPDTPGLLNIVHIPAIRGHASHSSIPLTSTRRSPSRTEAAYRSLLMPFRRCQEMVVQFTEQLTASSRKRRKEKEAAAAVEEPARPKVYLETRWLTGRCSDVDFPTLVKLPQGTDPNEWLATNTTALFEHVNVVYGTVSEFCTACSCPTMNAPNNVQYLWTDEKGKKVKCVAPQYVDYTMTYIQKCVNDETIFPVKYGQEFPGNFLSICQRVHRYLLHVMAHLYHAHFREVSGLGLHTHLNGILLHFTAFNDAFKLCEEKETEVLGDLVKLLLSTPVEFESSTLLLPTAGLAGTVMGPAAGTGPSGPPEGPPGGPAGDCGPGDSGLAGRAGPVIPETAPAGQVAMCVDDGWAQVHHTKKTDTRHNNGAVPVPSGPSEEGPVGAPGQGQGLGEEEAPMSVESAKTPSHQVASSGSSASSNEAAALAEP